MQLITHTAPRAIGLHPTGGARSVAKSVGVAECVPGAALQTRALQVIAPACTVGKVHAHGAWRDADVRAQLSGALKSGFAPALRVDLDWYQCRGAFFHNDAHYDARLFGIWCIVGSPAEIVFPRAALRLPVRVGRIYVFDPFEVHGVLAPDRSVYAEDDYRTAEPSVFIGFELDITPAIAIAFAIEPDEQGQQGRVISSRTRIAADSGALDGD